MHRKLLSPRQRINDIVCISASDGREARSSVLIRWEKETWIEIKIQNNGFDASVAEIGEGGGAGN